MYSWSTRGTVIATTECQWPYWKLPERSALKNPDNSPEALACFPYIPPLIHEQSICDITKWCQNHLLPLFSRKGTAHVQESHTDLPAHPLASLPTIFYSYTWAMLSFLYPEFWACGIYTSDNLTITNIYWQMTNGFILPVVIFRFL